YLEYENHNGIVAQIISDKNEITVAIRGDIDALPIEEENDLEFKSTNSGVMHACGHDAHTTILLGACKVLYDMREKLHVNVKFFFQPAEEGFGGAKLLVEDKCMENPKVDYIFGLHVMPHIETGYIETKYNTLNASVDTVTITINGKKAHGAYPENGIDAIFAASQVVSSIQSIISRNLAPVNPVVLTLGKINGGEASNIICDKVVLEGTLRTLNKETRDFVVARLNKIVENTCSALGCKGEVSLDTLHYPAVVNDKDLVDVIKNNAINLFGEDKFIMRENASLGGEDFSFFTENCKGGFFHLGCRNEAKNIISPLHTTTFQIDEDCLPIGVMMHVMNVLNFNEINL
ncbi:MAG: M20 family metallopeptidase, partial [Intestinibacter sp.]|uniref:M20 metallopeptidase family protein n=1 Tax=Intestinibacter sp. TaxID=1965304 RepID=UPI003F186CA3